MVSETPWYCSEVKIDARALARSMRNSNEIEEHRPASGESAPLRRTARALGTWRHDRGQSVSDVLANPVVDSCRSVDLELRFNLIGIIGLSCSLLVHPKASRHGDAEGIVVKLSRYFLNCLRGDGEFIRYRTHPQQTGQPSVLLLAPTRPRPERNLKLHL